MLKNNSAYILTICVNLPCQIRVTYFFFIKFENCFTLVSNNMYW